MEFSVERLFELVTNIDKNVAVLTQRMNTHEEKFQREVSTLKTDLHENVTKLTADAKPAIDMAKKIEDYEGKGRTILLTLGTIFAIIGFTASSYWDKFKAILKVWLS